MHKKEYDKEIGFFNFKITTYDSPSSDFYKEHKISYFSEVSIDQKFQGYKLFNFIFDAYTESLKELNVDVDYLHVRSQLSFTASLYKKKDTNLLPIRNEFLLTTTKEKMLI